MSQQVESYLNEISDYANEAQQIAEKHSNPVKALSNLTASAMAINHTMKQGKEAVNKLSDALKPKEKTPEPDEEEDDWLPNNDPEPMESVQAPETAFGSAGTLTNEQETADAIQQASGKSYQTMDFQPSNVMEEDEYVLPEADELGSTVSTAVNTAKSVFSSTVGNILGDDTMLSIDAITEAIPGLDVVATPALAIATAFTELGESLSAKNTPALPQLQNDV